MPLNPKLLDWLGNMGIGLMRAGARPGASLFEGFGEGLETANEMGRRAMLDKRATELYEIQKKQLDAQVAANDRKAAMDKQVLATIGLMGAPTERQNFFGQERMNGPSQLQQAGYDPAAIGLMNIDPELARKVIADRATQHEAGFTLQPGDTRYGGEGKILAQGPPAPLKAPTSRTRNVGGLEIFEEFNPKDGTWTKLSEAGRWKPDSAPQLSLSERRHDDEIDGARRAIRARFPKLDANEIRGRVNPAADSFNPPDAELRRLLHVATEKKFGDDAEHTQWGALGLEPVPDSPVVTDVPENWGRGPAISGSKAPDEGSGRWLGPKGKPTPGKLTAGMNFDTLKKKADANTLTEAELKDLLEVDPVVYRKLKNYLMTGQ